jgi:hypothetical protein
MLLQFSSYDAKFKPAGPPGRGEVRLVMMALITRYLYSISLMGRWLLTSGPDSGCSSTVSVKPMRPGMIVIKHPSPKKLILANFEARRHVLSKKF